MKKIRTTVTVLLMTTAVLLSAGCAVDVGEEGEPLEGQAAEENVESVSQATHGSYVLSCNNIIIYNNHTGPDMVCATCRRRDGNWTRSCAYECGTGLTNCNGRLVCATHC